MAQQAACVYLCAREWTTQQQLDAGRGAAAANIQRRGMITQLNAAGAQQRCGVDRVELEPPKKLELLLR